MIRHVVMWRVRGETAAEREAESRTVKTAFQTLRGQIPGMHHLEVGLGIIAGDDMCDVVLIADFDSLDALEAYAVHPKHLSVRDQLAGIRVSRHSVDFECDVG
jgi:hypothetical protein